MNKAKELFERLNRQDEDTRLEAKPGNAANKTLMETVCAFSNEPGLDGGIILMGVDAQDYTTSVGHKEYTVTGVPDPDKISSDIASQCSTMFNIPVRPSVETEHLDGKNIVVVTVPELDNRSKPLYFKNEGLPRGAYRRIGASAQRINVAQKMICLSSSAQKKVSIVQLWRIPQWMTWMRMHWNVIAFCDLR